MAVGRAAGNRQLLHAALFDQPAVIQRRRNLEDALSSLVIAGIDFDALTDHEYRRHRAEGLTFTNRTEPTG